MWLKTWVAEQAVHTDLVSAAGWNAFNELFTASDDATIRRWGMGGEPISTVAPLEGIYVTDLHWLLGFSRRQQSGSESFALGCTDGKFIIMSRSGRVEKAVEAHRGACIALRWNHEGTALVTVGEDGAVKVWSKQGQLRASLAQADRPVYSVAWGPDSDQVLYCAGKELVVKPLQPSAKQTQWKAHEGTVLKVDWSPVSGLIVSGGEDCKYKVWDAYGRLLFTSAPAEHAVTSVAWCPAGDLFAVGSFNSLRLCDATGWSYCKAAPKCGSVLNLAWAADGMQLAGAGGSGAVVFGQLLGQQLEWEKYTARLEAPDTIKLEDVLTGAVEELAFRKGDRVVKMSFGHGHLVVATAAQCYVYTADRTGPFQSTAHIFDLKDPVSLIVQCAKHFLLVDNFAGLQLYSFEGRPICNPKFAGLRAEMLNAATVSLAPDSLAVIDRSDNKTIRCFDTSQGKPIAEPLVHNLEVVALALNQVGPSTDRKLVFIDRNRDLYLTPLLRPALVKLGAMVDSALWHESSNMLAAMMDRKLVVWYHPATAYIDKDLLPATKFIRDGPEFANSAQIASFHRSRAAIRLSDGAVVQSAISPYPAMLHELAASAAWDKAARLCRFVKDSTLWACLAGLAIGARELYTAEVAYAAIDEVDKLQHVLYIKEVPSEEGRAAELALFRRAPEEAERILLQAGLHYRAISTCMKLFQWERALKLAVQHRTHVDTVVFYRRKYMASAGLAEPPGSDFHEGSEICRNLQIDEATIMAKIQQEEAKEATRGH